MEQAEVKYAPGMRIIVRGEEWMVKKVETNSLGNQTLYVIGLSQLVKDYESMFLVDVENDIEIVDPAKVTLVPDDSAFFRKSKVYIESQWRSKIPTDNKIHIGNKAAMDLMSYQLEPAQMALNKTRQRILIADTVGLGKTLEAGILMSELIARGKGKRILVVTVKSMMTQFQKEMWNRFTIPLVRLDSSRIQSVRAKLPTNYNPFFYYDKTIISVDTLKNDLDYRTHLENAWWDIIVIDEAHNVAKRGDRSSQRSKLASLLANRSDTLIMLTATPHDGKGQSVASLMNMLDPTAIADEENYTKDDIEGLLIRRFKKDIQDQVSGAFKERVITIERCVASAREEAAYDIFADMKLQMDESRTRGKGILFKTSLEKSLFSSPAACIKSIDARLRKLEKKYPDGDMPDIATLKELKAALELISPADFSRYAKLLKLLNSTEYGWSPSKNNDRLVIFTERIETMKYLAENLKKDLGLKDNQLEVMHGGTTGNQKPIAVFTDGYYYHKDIVEEDTLKRMAIILSRKYRVWSLTYKDVHNVFKSQGDYRTETLNSVKMPSGKVYKPAVKSANAEFINPEKENGFELLIDYLSIPNAEDLFATHARSFAMSIVDATQMRNQVLYGEWSSKWKSVLNAIGSLDDVDDFGQAIFGTWRPRQDMGNIDVLAEVSLAEMTGMRMGAPLKIVAIIDDVPDSRTDKYESDWNGFWHFVNVMQFNSTAVFLSKLGISKAIYSNLGTIIAEADAPEVALGTDVVVDEKWNDIMDDFIDDIAITCATEMHNNGIPAPSVVGFELSDEASGATIAEAEMAWEDKKIVWLLPEQEDYMDVFKDKGWTVLLSSEEININVFGGTVNE